MEKLAFESTNQHEMNLALEILRLPESMEAAEKDLALNKITDQLYEIAVKVSEFYGSNKVIGSKEEASRIALLVATKKTMEFCFGILGMKYLDRI